MPVLKFHAVVKEIVQLYVADKESTVIRPAKELKGFEKVELANVADRAAHCLTAQIRLNNALHFVYPRHLYGRTIVQHHHCIRLKARSCRRVSR